MTITVATLGGLKLNDTIDYKNKVSHFVQVSADFKARSKNYFGENGWYLPKWEDDAAWEGQYQKELKSKSGREIGTFKKSHPTAQNFRDFCYDKAKKNEDCNGDLEGWCADCSRDQKWDQKT